MNIIGTYSSSKASNGAYVISIPHLRHLQLLQILHYPHPLDHQTTITNKRIRIFQIQPPISKLLWTSSVSNQLAGIQQTMPWILLLLRRGLVLAQPRRHHRSAAERAIGVRVKPHVYTRSMKHMCASRQFLNLFPILKRRQTNCTFIPIPIFFRRCRRREPLLEFEAAQRALEATAWIHHLCITSSQRRGSTAVAVVRAPLDNDEIVKNQHNRRRSDDHKAIIQHG